MFTELGAGAKAGRHGTEDEIWTEQFQAGIHRRQIEMIRPIATAVVGEVAGLSPRIPKDFRAPVRVLPGIQDGDDRKGLLIEEGERKLAFVVLRTFYEEIGR